ncbi:MAG: uracil-DNA glycosylase [Spirochaetaceae bacterium]|jgi:DNA polymerase|nr:uracil-DNA glycosylase [Spirochaetaceae bacterium]
MTTEQKMSTACFLDTAYAFFKTGYFEESAQRDFTDDVEESIPENETARMDEFESSERDGSVYEGVAAVGELAACESEFSYGENESSGGAEASAPPEVAETLEEIAGEVQVCARCALCETRIKAVPGEGPKQPLVLVVGEGPGADEDASGRPFVGAAGRLLDKMLLSIGLERGKNCFIANVIKCRPPRNRDPYPEETEACLPFFERQFALLNPALILTVGKVPVKTLLGTNEGITRLRGNWRTYRGVPLLPTFHPSYLLRDESQKQFAWEDLKSLCRRLAEIDAIYAAETAELRKSRNI